MSPRQSAGEHWVGIDVGGTKVLGGLVDATGRVLRTERRATGGRDGSAQALEQTLTEVLEAVSKDVRPSAVGVAAAGLVDAAGERLTFAPHLPWRDEPLRAGLEARWGLPVVLENDATCAVWAEREHGALQGCDSGLLVTVGTGIGGGLLIGGRVVRGAGGMAGEFGHMPMVPGGRECPCGLVGCWEQYVSGTALLGAARRLAAARSAETPSVIDGPEITRSALDGDPDALAAFSEVGHWLGVGVAGLVSALDPERVVIGGGVSSAGDLLLGPAREALATHLVGAGPRVPPPRVPAVHGEYAAVVGAVALARASARG